MSDVFSISGQHYLFAVQTFAQVILSEGGDNYRYEFFNRTTQGVIDDVKTGESDLGIIVESSDTAEALNVALDREGLKFHKLMKSKPMVALGKSHPLSNAQKLGLDDLIAYPYVHFYQGEDAPDCFYEEALGWIPREKSIACTDRASLSELIVALNGYTITSGILVGVTDGSLLKTVPLETDIELNLGFVTRKDVEPDSLSGLERNFIDKLTRNLKNYVKM